MIREELLHSALTHFPIAIFALALMFKIAELVFKGLDKPFNYELGIITKALLFIGPLFYLLSIYLGDMSLEIIKNDICNLTLAYEHEEAAEVPIPFFLLCIVLEVLLLMRTKAIDIWKNAIQCLIVLSLFTGNFLMFHAAHLGGELVYEYGAAVKDHQCKN